MAELAMQRLVVPPYAGSNPVSRLRELRDLLELRLQGCDHRGRSQARAVITGARSQARAVITGGRSQARAVIGTVYTTGRMTERNMYSNVRAVKQGRNIAS